MSLLWGGRCLWIQLLRKGGDTILSRASRTHIPLKPFVMCLLGKCSLACITLHRQKSSCSRSVGSPRLCQVGVSMRLIFYESRIFHGAINTVDVLLIHPSGECSVEMVTAGSQSEGTLVLVPFGDSSSSRSEWPQTETFCMNVNDQNVSANLI